MEPAVETDCASQPKRRMEQMAHLTVSIPGTVDQREPSEDQAMVVAEEQEPLSSLSPMSSAIREAKTDFSRGMSAPGITSWIEDYNRSYAESGSKRPSKPSTLPQICKKVHASFGQDIHHRPFRC
eukprot:TRINITY_DN110872_c0_g1_i1.p1 TRINITY_DN110872_c0_g1~~TRINITY_DN110872_c0_g1_i1.p1  ORF type:complete len:125 (-),score=20.48 TRINITY_DN110872_c0_g1_i1:175-549(-)